MLFANDINGNKISANSETKYKECFCRVCGEPVIHRMGQHNIPHFAHLADSNCSYGKDKDDKSEWHRRMQGLFPDETNEVIFVDKNTGEKHIADVYLKDSNTVIEFQKSPISDTEFFKRTTFHTSEGRRIVWIYYEETDKGEYGRFKKDDLYELDWIHKGFCFKWLRTPRKELRAIPELNYNNYSVCVYYGDGLTTIHRIIHQEYGFEYVTFSVHAIELSKGMDYDDFFKAEGYWLSQSPWMEKIAERNAMIAKRIQTRRQPLLPPSLGRRKRNWWL